MKKYLTIGLVAVVLMGTTNVPNAHAVTMATECADQVTVAGLTRCLAYLKDVIATLTPAQTATTGGDATSPIKTGLKLGDRDPDVTKIQEILARDEATYPEGLVTGYFGLLTQNALKRFQARHGLSATGLVDDPTYYLLVRYFCLTYKTDPRCASYANVGTTAKAITQDYNDRDYTGNINDTTNTSIGGFLSGVSNALGGLVDGLLGGIFGGPAANTSGNQTSGDIGSQDADFGGTGVGANTSGNQTSGDIGSQDADFGGS